MVELASCSLAWLCWTTVSKILVLTQCRFIIQLFILLSFFINTKFLENIHNGSFVYNCTTSIISSKGPTEWWHCWRCWENFEFWFCCLYDNKRSLYLVWKVLPVCPRHFWHNLDISEHKFHFYYIIHVFVLFVG